MSVSASRDELVSTASECLGKSLVVGQNLLLVFLVDGLLALPQGNSKGSNGVIVRSTLVSGEDRGVDWTFQVIEDF